ncbi:MAG: hypothetical protein GEU80_15215 [Dehalococcoidia bacterium]|nr:hypothetical protein [Dehalococcoidia bacterium]
MTGRPLVISHRTDMGTCPENTLAGIDAALAAGADGVEVDVRATAEGEVILLHDASLRRTTDDHRDVSSVTLAELRSVRVGPRAGDAAPLPVPTLREALERVDGRSILVIELKQPGIEAAVAQLVREARAAEWCWVWAFNPSAGATCRAALPEVPVALNTSAGSAARYGYVDPIEVAVRAGFAAVSPDHSMVDRALVDGARRRGLAVYTWTVNDRADIERVVDAGVDAVCGDDAAAIMATLEG